jgi:hypothetical protein
MLLRFLYSTVAFFSVFTILPFTHLQSILRLSNNAYYSMSATPKAAATPKAIHKAKTTPKAKKGKGGGHKASAQNFNDEDKEFLIILLEEIRPIGPEMWDQVVSCYNNKYAEPN